MTKKTALLNLRVSVAERDAWHKAAQARGTTLSEMIRKYMNKQARK